MTTNTTKTKACSKRGVPEKKNRKGNLSEKSSSFHGRVSPPSERKIRRPKGLPDLLPYSVSSFNLVMVPVPVEAPRLTKILLNVTIQRSVGPVQVVMSSESSVGDLIAAAVSRYVKEGRRPILESSDPSRFDLHYSQFNLESLGRDEKLMILGTRNFFLCCKKAAAADGGSASTCGSSTATVEKATQCSFNWFIQ